MVQERNTLILYTTATCNLNCIYCYIDKNPALVEIDNILDDSFKGDYYFNFTKEMFPDPNQLNRIEFWGGEPTLRLDRAIYTVKKIIEYYPNLHDFYMSTNFTNHKWNEQFFGFITALNEFKNRKFHFLLQLSIDGPKEINDVQRGKGVTDKFIIQFDRFIHEVNKNPDSNVQITICFKPTLTSEIISKYLPSKDKIIEYYKFFEDFNDYFRQNIKVRSCTLELPIPNTATPSPHTKDDGIDFARFCCMCKEIMNENNNMQIFKYYSNIMPFVPANIPDYDNPSYCQSCGACGSGKFNVGLLPYHRISCCHNGFVNLISDYKKRSMEADKSKKILDFKFFMDESNSMIQTVEGYKQYEKNVDFVYNLFSETKLANMAGAILLLAANDQIDKKYTSPKEAQKAALFVQQACAYCMRDNVSVTGSVALYPFGLLKLLLNGAREVIENYG